MSAMDSFLNYLVSLPDALIYLVLGVSAFVENVFPPIPGDTITAFGAFLVGTDKLSFAGVYLSTTTGSFLGFMTLFHLGTYLGKHFFMRRNSRYFKARDIDRAENWFQKYGYSLIALNRFLPGVRSVISISAGVSRLGHMKVSCMALLSCSVWNLIWIFMGYQLGTHWELVQDNLGGMLARYNIAVYSFFGLLVLFVLLRRLRLRRRSEGS
jgi:membrane protein DedA with SNARE-associated domain